jgi:hypothetical protein
MEDSSNVDVLENNEIKVDLFSKHDAYNKRKSKLCMNKKRCNNKKEM